MKENFYGRDWESVVKRKILQFEGKEREVIDNFHKRKIIEGLSFRRIEKLLYVLQGWRQYLPNKPLQELNKQDILDGVVNLEKSDKAEWTKRDYKMILKIFIRFIRGVRGTPVEFEDVSFKMKRNLEKADNEPLDEEDIKKLINSTNNLRSKAIISLLWEAGLRSAELLGIHIQDITNEEMGIRIRVTGKTGRRKILVISSEPYLASWLRIHPYKDSPLAYLFCCDNRREMKTLGHRTLFQTLMEAKYNTKIAKKCNPHWLRHSSITDRAKKGWNQAQLSAYFGWVQGSDMANTYVHVNAEDVDNAVMHYNGMNSKKEITTSNSQPKICPRCKEQNGFADETCIHCGAILSHVTKYSRLKQERKQVKEIKELKEELVAMRKQHEELLTGKFLERLIDRRLKKEKMIK